MVGTCCSYFPLRDLMAVLRGVFDFAFGAVLALVFAFALGARFLLAGVEPPFSAFTLSRKVDGSQA